MALTTDQIMMLAHLADFAGQKLAPENPFAGYASQYVQARNFAKLLQQGGGAPETPPKKEEPKEETSALGPPNPFTPDYTPPAAPGSNYKTQQMPEVTPEHKDASVIDWIFTSGVEAKVDADNNLTLTRKLPANVRGDMPKKAAAASDQVTNPFWYLG